MICGLSEAEHPYYFYDDMERCPICYSNAEYIVEDENEEDK